ncbi:hypothetical protein GCM10009549_43820 [Streptomyces thermoalcalitolerans]|uniref:Uncharacterized protein n=1 Tax=Streptomyces thermoalcalitolerans TaxID=65605 RepID=A0ABN1P7Z5_9ACTN
MRMRFPFQGLPRGGTSQPDPPPDGVHVTFRRSGDSAAGRLGADALPGMRADEGEVTPGHERADTDAHVPQKPRPMHSGAPPSTGPGRPHGCRHPVRTFWPKRMSWGPKPGREALPPLPLGHLAVTATGTPETLLTSPADRPPALPCTVAAVEGVSPGDVPGIALPVIAPSGAVRFVPAAVARTVPAGAVTVRAGRGAPGLRRVVRFGRAPGVHKATCTKQADGLDPVGRPPRRGEGSGSAADDNVSAAEPARWGGWDSNPRPTDYESVALTG